MTEMRDFCMLHTINDASLSVCTVFGAVAEGLILRFVKYRQDMATWLNPWQEVWKKRRYKRIFSCGRVRSDVRELHLVVHNPWNCTVHMFLHLYCRVT